METTPFHELAVDDIARAAGLSRSAFYRYYQDKYELLMTATEQAADALYAEADRWWHGEGEPEALVRRAIEGVAEAYSRYDRVLSVATEVSTYDDEVRRFWRGLVERFVDATDRHIALEQSEGRIRPLDSRRTAEALVWMTERACYVYVARRERAPRDVVAALTEVWVGALYAQR